MVHQWSCPTFGEYYILYYDTVIKYDSFKKDTQALTTLWQQKWYESVTADGNPTCTE